MKREEILFFLKDAPFSELMEKADRIRLKHKGAHVFVRALIEFSNICRRNCLYCGLRAANCDRERYSLGRDEIQKAALVAAEQGADTIVLQSGEGAVDACWLAELLAELARNPGLPLTLSVGECAYEDYALWRKAGAKRFLLRHETSDPKLYASLHPGYKLSHRLECMRSLRELGYECGGGFMTGLPGQSLLSIADDLLLCQALKLDMAGVGPFLSQSATPLAASPSGSLDLALRAVAILRLLLPDANLPATTALASLDPANGQVLGLRAGANVLMPNFTPGSYAGLYKIYDGKKHVNLENAAHDIARAGRSHSLKVRENE